VRSLVGWLVCWFLSDWRVVAHSSINCWGIITDFCVGTNCSGTNAVRYGPMRSWVLNLTVVLADGTIIKTRNRPIKSAAGYNLNGIFVGSEGTLGLVTEITVRLACIPKYQNIAVVNFPTIKDAANTASAIMKAGVPIAALEFLDATQMAVYNRGGYTKPRIWAEEPTLFFKFSGSEASVVDNIREVQRIAKANNGGKFEFAKDEKEQNVLWSARKQVLWSLLAARPEGTQLWTTDVAVPISRLAEMIGIFFFLGSHLLVFVLTYFGRNFNSRPQGTRTLLLDRRTSRRWEFPRSHYVSQRRSS
jgi:D-lactate dehydrogenase (cytochrome)